jgi:hypothetical protein
MSLDRGLVAELKAIVGRDHVRTEPGDVEPFARDATPSLPGRAGTAWPGRAPSRRSRRCCGWPPSGACPWCPAAPAPTCARPPWPSAAGSCCADPNGPHLEVSRDEMLARVEAGVTTVALAEAAAAKGLRYTPDPGAAPCRRSAEMWPPVPAACVGSNTGSPTTTCSAAAGDHLLDPRPDRAGRDAAGWASGKRRGPARRCRAPTPVQVVNSYLNEMANRIR